ncbi:uncharacterized protein N7459_004332 [Penicillium hispanicum]|uniref:uncharacterized protein n=1 Tax=Penicillium hispanicum TaxID=1080232 RepID=UPI00254177F9|nr:uncharacterized protein N7459_004332 [Penicillium hispanicum]KAJ5584532.1 hypothetical protein N7459_004332 [Penicillium hispanicum]
MNTQEPSARARVACETCRKRKRKCDGAQPRCAGCVGRNLDCHYELKRSTRQKRGQDYMSGLEGQIELLKQEVCRLEASQSNHAHPGTRQDPSFTRRAPGEEKTQPHETAIVDLLASSLKQPCPIQDVSALMWHMQLDDTGKRAFIGPSGNFCFPVVPTKPVTRDMTSHSPSLRSREMSPGKNPPRFHDEAQITNYLLDLFQQFINPIHFFVDHDTLVQIRGESPKPELTLVKYAAIAAASLLADDEGSKIFGNDAASAVDTVILPACREYPSVWAVQALSIMCWRELGLEHHNMAWMYNSMCASMALHLGLPVSSLKILDDERSEHEESANSDYDRAHLTAGWSSLLIDRYSFQFHELDEPEKYRLLLNARDQLLAFYRNLDTRLYMRTADPCPPVIILHMSYNMSQMLIHRPYLKHPAQSSAFQLSVRTMWTAATAMVSLIRQYERVGQLEKAPPFVVHSILTAAVTHLLNATSSQPALRSQSISRFRVCFDALTTMQKRWPKAARSVSLLQGLAQRWGIMLALPLHGFPEVIASDHATPATPTALSCEEMPPSTSNPKEPSDYPVLDDPFDGLSWAEVDPTTFVSNGAEYMEMSVSTDPWSAAFPEHEDIR